MMLYDILPQKTFRLCERQWECWSQTKERQYLTVRELGATQLSRGGTCRGEGCTHDPRDGFERRHRLPQQYQWDLSVLLRSATEIELSGFSQLAPARRGVVTVAAGGATAVL